MVRQAVILSIELPFFSLVAANIWNYYVFKNSVFAERQTYFFSLKLNLWLSD